MAMIPGHWRLTLGNKVVVRPNQYVRGEQESQIKFRGWGYGGVTVG